MLINNFVPAQSIFNNGIVNGIGNELENESVENSFQSILEDSINKINDQQLAADQITNEFVAGEDVEIHEMMLNMSEAEMSLDLAIQVRNKVVDAVKELTNMQL